MFVTCESAAEERTAHSSTGGALIFWLLPIVVVVVVDTQVHCELGHLSSHSGSQQIPALRGAGNRALYGDNSTAERQTTKQMSASYFTLYHRLSISFSTLHLSLSLCMPYFVNTVLFCFGSSNQFCLATTGPERWCSVCAFLFFILRVYRNLKRQRR